MGKNHNLSFQVSLSSFAFRPFEQVRWLPACRRFVFSFLFFISVMTAITSCKDPGSDADGMKKGVKPDDLEPGNEWIYDELCDVYYWRDAVRAVSPRSELEYDLFLNSLLSNLKGARDNSESPPTIDGSYSYNNGRYTRNDGCYSYVERSDASTRAVETTTLFGFDIMYVSNIFPGNAARCALLVAWVQPGSPAAKAGIKRGTWIETYGGKNIYDDDAQAFWRQLHYLEGGAEMTFTVRGGTKKYSLTATVMKDNPIILDTMITSPRGKKVAYLVYKAFEQGEIEADGGHEFENDLREAFGRFKNAGADELVLDLRYNPGGALPSCHLLSSLAGNVNGKQTFAKLRYNKDTAREKGWRNPDDWKFSDEPNSLKCDRVYVLAQGTSASASELVINSLRGVDNLEVIHIGGRTNGKNVGMTLSEKTVGEYRYTMWPITFKIMNADDFSDYAGGFVPDYPENELFEVLTTPGGGTMYPFGDRRELLLKAALEHIDTGWISRSSTRAAAQVGNAHILQDPRTVGARIVRDENGEIVH